MFDIGNGLKYIGPCNIFYKFRILGIAIGGGFEFTDQAGKVAQCNVVACPLDHAAAAMTQHNDYFCSADFAGKFHAAQNIVIHDIPRYPDTEKVTQALVKDEFRRRPGIYAT